ncbi:MULTISPECIES: CaiB/BaiF CoA-transferase family protein [unclassified Variovorax]|uniref:CaiB/BaiF CoA transferase family protein n=1 Tax=unclassified Variovorax TaxID=663243 RepID=UPI0008B3C9D3|nr:MULTISPECIES: CaiB/BaiF CoA-transferase family protein [unclassified Variovorax]SEK12211.1 Crotonobetainyl-CoA:carnitine CoA-transferase CaiB [Variovorax sp. OK202]SFD79848.1 Crotonobetainyl-CoA:carnitine CoA-transferase CaiB [Variovorax sp. OK212]
MSQASSVQPLAGLRVLDLSRVLAGPMCAMALADLGADVIKVEHPSRGDDTRDWGVRVGTRNTSYFNSANRNKRSITIDLQSSTGVEIARDLAARSDVVIENFKVGGADKLGLGYAQLSAANPGLVYCSISGYSRMTAEAERPGYDLLVQGEAGIMAMNGEAGQGPLKFGVAAVDMFTGMYAGQAILAALYERHTTQRGRHVQMALYDSGLMITSYYGMEAMLKAGDPPKFGNAHPSIVPYGVFDAADGPLVITVGNNGQFVRFCEQVLGKPEWAADERFATNTARSANREILLPLVREALRAFGRRELLAKLSDAQIPCGEVLGMYEALSSARTSDAKLLHRFEDTEAGPQSVLAPPYVLDGERAPVRRVPPHLGEHTDEVLREVLAMDDEAIAAARAQQAI